MRAIGATTRKEKFFVPLGWPEVGLVLPAAILLSHRRCFLNLRVKTSLYFLLQGHL